MNTKTNIIYRAWQRFDCTIAAYNVSGEYMMVKSSVEAGLADEQAATMEVLTSIKRAGADIIISYSAKDSARLLS